MEIRPTTLEFTVPELTRLLPAARPHPRGQELEQHVTEWARQHLHWLLPQRGDLERYLARGTIQFDVLFFPTAEYDRIADMAVFDLLAFLLDDLVDEPATVTATPPPVDMDTVISVLADAVRSDAPPAGGPTILVELHERLQQIKSRMPAPLRGRFIATAVDYINLQRFAAGKSPADLRMDQEAALRRHWRHVGAPVALVQIEYALGIDLTDDLAASPALSAIGDTAMRHAMLVNDLFAYRKEYFHGDLAMNSLAALQRTEGMSLQEAVDRQCAMILDTERQFYADRQSLLVGALGTRTAVRSYLEALEYYLAANLRWHSLAGRFHGPGHSCSGLMRGTWTLLPERTVFTPLSPV